MLQLPKGKPTKRTRRRSRNVSLIFAPARCKCTGGGTGAWHGRPARVRTLNWPRARGTGVPPVSGHSTGHGRVARASRPCPAHSTGHFPRARGTGVPPVSGHSTGHGRVARASRPCPAHSTGHFPRARGTGVPPVSGTLNWPRPTGAWHGRLARVRYTQLATGAWHGRPARDRFIQLAAPTGEMPGHHVPRAGRPCHAPVPHLIGDHGIVSRITRANSREPGTGVHPVLTSPLQKRRVAGLNLCYQL